MEFPTYLPVGPWQLHPHVLFELLAYSLGFQLFLALRRRRGEVLGAGQRPVVVLAAVAGALLGSKLLAWLTDPAALWAARADPAAWLAGKTIVGGLLGGWAAVELAKRGLGVARSTGDLFAAPLALGIVVGRIGCFLTGLDDRTHGVATGLPWGVDFGDGVARHPTQLYEIGFLLLLLGALAWQRRRGHAEGDAFKLFMAGYLGWRLLVGFIQPAPTFLGLAAIQWACLGGLAVLAPHAARIARGLAGRNPAPEGAPT